MKQATTESGRGTTRVHHGSVGRCLRDRLWRAARRGASVHGPMGGADYATLSPEQKAKAIARGKANRAVYYGELLRQPCEVCGREPAEKHHPDYDKPRDVEWLCPTHHREREAMNRIRPHGHRGAVADPPRYLDSPARPERSRELEAEVMRHVHREAYRLASKVAGDLPITRKRVEEALEATGEVRIALEWLDEGGIR